MDVLIVTLALSVVAPLDFQEIDNSTEALWELVHDLREEVQELKNQDNNDAWFNEQRAIETKNLANQILRDADLRSSLQGLAQLRAGTTASLLFLMTETSN